jgi:hypothetical protein
MHDRRVVVTYYRKLLNAYGGVYEYFSGIMFTPNLVKVGKGSRAAVR